MLKEVFIIVMSDETGKEIVLSDSETTGFKHIYNTLEEAEEAMEFIARLPSNANILKFTRGDGERGLMMEKIDISKIDKADLLVALYNAAKPKCLGFLQSLDSSDMTIKEARELLDQYAQFDYLYGRVMKVNISGDFLDPRLYDMDNGEGAAMRAIKHLMRR